MPKYSDETKYKALSLLHAGDEPRAVSSKTEVPVFTVLKWKKELDKAVEEGHLNQLIDMDRVVLEKVIEGVVETSAELEEPAQELAESISSLDKLNTELHMTAMHINKQVKTLAIKSDSAPELLTLAEIICEIQKAFFNSQATNINVQNNFENRDSSAYQAFLSDKP